MTADHRSLDDIFTKAIRYVSTEDRAAFLDDACGGDLALLERLRRLLLAHDEAGSFLDSPAADPSPTVDKLVADQSGTQIGPYKLLQHLGEGGMGVVYMAEQKSPVRRRVALKIIKPGMDSQQVIARFEAERQALAMMDHPNIARVFDAGTTDSGRPYFVMELVNGIPITEYCDQRQLTAKERLKLFISVCHAIQHAHQKGIIHRDIKPGNVLVAKYDDNAVPKVIDFGVAKAISQMLTEKTMFTQLGQVVGTVEYMSPEQAQRNQLDVDTRSDIYSLGVVLYELLTGDTPFGKKRLRSAALDETLRIIREEEPPKPSTKVSTLGTDASSISKSRSTNPDGLRRTIRGDLDWVIMKALEKERVRRYDTAGSFAADIQNFLNGEAIEARRPSAIYRLRKTVTRHRVTFAVTSIVMLTLVGGIVASTWFAISAWEAEQRARSTVLKLHDQLIEKVILSALGGDREGTEEALKLASEAEVHSTTLRMLEGIACYHQGENETATKRLEGVLEDEPDNVLARAMLAMAHVHTGDWSKYVQQMDYIERSRKDSEYAGHESLILGYALLYFDTSESLRILQNTVDDHPSWLVARSILGAAKAHLALEEQDPVRARELSAESLRETKPAFQLLGENRVVAMYNLWAHHVAIYFAQRDGKPFDELRKSAEISVQSLRGSNASYTVGAFNTITYYLTINEPEAAMEVLDASRKNASSSGWMYHYAAFLVQQGRSQEALRILDATPPKDPDVLLAKAYLLIGIPERRGEAREISRELLEKADYLDSGMDAIDILCLLGDRDAATSESLKAWNDLKGGPAHSSSAKWLPYTCVRFHAHELSPEKFSEACSHSRIGRLMFHYCMAMRKLSEGDREAAREQFEECTRTGQLDWGPLHWARAFLRLMEDNQKWPGT